LAKVLALARFLPISPLRPIWPPIHLMLLYCLFQKKAPPLTEGLVKILTP